MEDAANFFAAGLKGRYKEGSYQDHLALEGFYKMWEPRSNGWQQQEIPLRNAMNAVLRDSYVEDCENALRRWNRTITNYGIPFRLRLPDYRFHRKIGLYAGTFFDPQGRPLAKEQWEARRDEFIPSEKDRAYVKNLMVPVFEVGKIANWISKPARGIKGLPFEFEYVRREQ